MYSLTSLSPTDHSGAFDIDKSSGSLVVARQLDRETCPEYKLEVRALDTSTSSNPQSSAVAIKIEIVDVNDNAPRWGENPLTIPVNEDTLVGSTIWNFTATDADDGSNGELRYGLVRQYPEGNHFSVDHLTGTLTLLQPLDYETLTSFILVVKVTDQAANISERLSTSLTARVVVKDLNDNAPVFVSPTRGSLIYVSEQTRVGSHVTKMTAVDQDSGDNGRVTYVISGGNEDARFHLDHDKGILSLARVISEYDHQSKFRAVLNITASDHGIPPKSSSLVINILSETVSTSLPTFLSPSYHANVSEDAIPGTYIIKVVARSPSTYGYNLTYMIPAGVADDMFKIDAETGVVTLARSLDRETVDQYNLVVHVTDSKSGDYDTTNVFITILDVNDNAPEFKSGSCYPITIPENSEAANVHTFIATDFGNFHNNDVHGGLFFAKSNDVHGGLFFAKGDDVHGGLFFAVQGNNIHDDSFLTHFEEFGFQQRLAIQAVDPLTGVLSVQQPLDYDTGSSEHLLILKVEDGGKPPLDSPLSSITHLKITLQDENDNAPKFPITEYLEFVGENEPIGSSVFTARATDMDKGDYGKLNYSIISAAASGYTDVDDSWKLFRVDALTGLVTTNAVFDYEARSRYAFTLLSTYSVWTRSLYALTGLVTTNAVFDYEARSRYAFTLLSTDSGGRTCKVKVRVEIESRDEFHPQFTERTFKFILSGTDLPVEDVPVGTVVQVVSASDADLGVNSKLSWNELEPNGLFSSDLRVEWVINRSFVVLDEFVCDASIVTSVQVYGSVVLDEFVCDASIVTSVQVYGSHLKDLKQTWNHYSGLRQSLEGSETNREPLVKLIQCDKTNECKTSKNGSESYNLTYMIPAGVADDMFKIDAETGVVTLARSLDRETVDQYNLVVHVTDSKSGDYDTTNVFITILDVNDNAPEFKSGSCYPITIPENSEAANVHTFIATDLDLGLNSQITYSITGGNLGNKFHIDPHTGQLTARSLDRELQAKYYLVISAQDKGSNPGPLVGTCNTTIIVEDQNDNNPIFPVSQYSLSIPEDVPVGTVVQVVSASDADLGVNSKLVFSLSNETDASFHIDNTTGAITTTTLFDRESRSSYYFLVVATDGGRYDRRSARVPVHIGIEDVNDNAPAFSRYPFTVTIPSYTQPGHDILRISASDADEGQNAEIVYKFVFESPNNKFRINPNTGVVSATSSLVGETGKYFGLEVMATDKGNPPLSATGLVEIRVGEMSDGAPVLKFQNASYVINIAENTPNGNEVLQVSEVLEVASSLYFIQFIYTIAHNSRTVILRDSKFRLILLPSIYLTFNSLISTDKAVGSVLTAVTANDVDTNPPLTYTLLDSDDTFSIDQYSGRILLRRPLDYETTKQYRLSVSASDMAHSAQTTLTLNVLDYNDNPPVFSQHFYQASIPELRDGDKILTVNATDLDSGVNSVLHYSLVNPTSGGFIIDDKTGDIYANRSSFRGYSNQGIFDLVVMARDSGSPSLSSTVPVRIYVENIGGRARLKFTQDEFSTVPVRIYVENIGGRARLKFTQDEFRENSFPGTAMVKINIIDVNDNQPTFPPHSSVKISENKAVGSVLTAVTANDVDTNPPLTYTLLDSDDTFSIDQYSGRILLRRPLDYETTKQYRLSVSASDMAHSAQTTLTLNVLDYNDNPPVFSQHFYQASIPVVCCVSPDSRISVREDTPRGSVILKVASAGLIDDMTSYDIISGDDLGHFLINSKTGELIIVKDLDRESCDSYKLWISSGPNSSSALVNIIIEDANDNTPHFLGVETAVTLSEGVPVGHTILRLTATDVDLPPNSDVRFEITSGNEEELFAVDPLTGVLSVQQPLDYDTGSSEHLLILKVEDGGKPPLDSPLSSITHLKITLQDENDNAPKFPITEYLEFVGENEPIGSSVFTARATDMDKGDYGKLNYSIISAAASGYTDVDDSWKLFRVDALTGLVTTNAVFDYEARSRYAFTLLSTDSGGRTCKVKVRVEIESRDEFHPQFTERTFKFILSGTDLPVGYVVGHVTATDRDKGPDGRVVYQLTSQHSFFKVNRTTGAVLIKKKLDGLETGQDISLVITASSGRQGSLTNMSVVEIAIDPLGYTGTNHIEGNTVSASSSSGVTNWAITLLVIFLLIIIASAGIFVFLHLKNRRQKKVNKPGLSNATTSENNYVDPGSFDTIPIRGSSVGVASPPKYDEIPTYRNNASGSNSAAATSELSGSDQSGSSGRGSAEDGDDVEDEEIRMINEGRRKEEDNMSVHNTQEYLARLGIVEMATAPGSIGTASAGPMDPQLNVFEEPDPDVSTLIYAKLSDVGSERGGEDVVCGRPSMTGSLSSIVHSEEELTGSYNWDYLLDWGPQYQPLAHVFSEIARLKDDAASVKSGASGASSSKSKSIPPVVKTVPPPLLTNVAPRSIAAPMLAARASHLQPQLLLLPRSPISHDPANFPTSAAMSPSFSPSLSPLANRSPSISPLHPPGVPPHHIRQRHQSTDNELRI
ncbi:protein dachsous [Diaphorina citri]|uniref:Protein dachsous n=2 Tax=Diaphorina citri TaxID=121845 RepID=A0A3Q0IQ67_DIACI|nr:protein dachsous [Diaphorina citri]